ncbi:hypothetical protein BJX70DRAFT_386958 [Aspergillus crustosus]
MSYKSDGGRIPRLREFGHQIRNASTPTIATQPSPYGLMTPSTKSRRAASMSEAEESRPIVAQSISLLSPDHRPYMAPRVPTHPPLSQSPNTTFDQHVPRTLHTPVVPQTPKTPIDNRPPVQARQRNVLRRRAPTIGQQNTNNKLQMQSMRPGGLNVIIPSSTTTDYSQPSSSQSSSQTELARKTPSPMVSQDQPTSLSAEQIYHGPKELASLRTTVNTQNLPPFTPIFPSASTPSTRYSGSPGVWSRTSASTPASLSSSSPGITLPMKVGPRLRQPSPSHTRLPVFSPKTQKPSLPSSPALGKSPSLPQGYGSTTSLLSYNREDSSERLEPVTSPVPGPSLLPRRTSNKSSIPRQTKATPDNSSKTEKVEVKRILDSGGAAGSKSAPKPQAKIPVRPSREGTVQLDMEPSPIVQTNISARALKGHRRRISAGSSTGLISNQFAAASVDSLDSMVSSRIRSPNSLDLARKSPKTLIKEPPRIAPADVSPGKTRRFGLFPRKSKPDLDARQPEARPARKGPTAGTGHEGYGKYGQRGRKSSVSSPNDSKSRARSTSTTKSVSSKGSNRSRADTELDDFLLERLEPVYINGGGVEGANLSRTQSEQSIAALSTKSAPIDPPLPPPGYHYEPTTLPAASAFTESHRRDLSSPATSVPSSNSRTKVPPLAGSEKSKSRPSIEPSRIAPRKNESDTSVRPPVTQPQLKKPSKRGLNLKWPFFQKESEPVLPNKQHAQASQLPAQVAPVGSRRPVAHYALVDTDSDPLEEIFHKLEDSPPTEETEDDDFMSPVDVPAGLNIRKHHESILLPSPPKLHSEFPPKRPAPGRVRPPKEVISPKQDATPEERPSRLASVGRIPRVVSRRDRQHKPAMQSFSRPFSVTESPGLTALAPGQTHGFSSPVRRDQGPHPEAHRKPENPGFDITSPFGDPVKGSALDFLAGPYSKQEFLAFSPRKDSVFSTSSGSESLAAITAVIPGPGTELDEDEIWGEYDEFIDHVFSPETPDLPFPRGLETREKFVLAARASRALQAGLNSKLAVPTTSPEQPTVSFTPASPQESVASVRLRRSKIANALHSSLSPTSQPSVSDMLARFRDDHDDDIDNIMIDVQTPVVTVEQPQSNLLSSPSLDPSPSFENYRQRNTIMFDIAERDREGPTAQTNIRSGSLMTSRWLSFGRVLFSPAHKHVRQGEQQKILVVDGLGNDDWSFYCALTYPHADVYCLHEGPTPTASTHPAAWQPPSNHHTIHHASLEDPVPFPKGFFAATVLRFPAACSEAAQNNIISECKRVLRPGGYLEMSILDHDMVNMGVRTRRAVRKLKETMYLADATISLKPASDNIQKLLGTHGFDNLRRCMVRIPVAGMIVRSSASSTSTSSSNPSTLTAAVTSSTALSAASTSSPGQRSNTHEKSSSNDTVLSLGDLLSDPSPSPSNDESIRKIVARVGRWWYTRCYESPVLPNGDVDRSLWANKKVLRECQQRGTGFRLLIAYTQKPSEKRRTASV